MTGRGLWFTQQPLSLWPFLSPPLASSPAILLFVFVTCGLLAYSITDRGWARLPLFGSSAFIVAAGAAQWSPLFTAAIGLPVLGAFFAAKPTIGLAIGISGTRRLQVIALAGATVIGTLSLVLFPAWPGLWLGQLHYATQMAPPFMRFGGAFILLALIRWRRPEARLLLAMALIPQVGSWYEALPIFLVPKTYKETLGLALTSLAGFHVSTLLPDGLTETQINDAVGSLMVASIYLPAIIIILRRLPETQRAASPSR